MKLSSQRGLAHSQTIPNPKQYLFTVLKSLSIMILKNIYMQQEFKEKSGLQTETLLTLEQADLI